MICAVGFGETFRFARCGSTAAAKNGFKPQAVGNFVPVAFFLDNGCYLFLISPAQIGTLFFHSLIELVENWTPVRSSSEDERDYD